MTEPIEQKPLSLAEMVEALRENHLQVATAESCTAGLLSAAITSVSGASAVFSCGVAAYSIPIKHQVLGVPEEILSEHGAISAETAAAMANGARMLARADIGLAITGVAGPSTDEGKPVGTVYVALANEDRVFIEKLEPEPAAPTRDAVRGAAVDRALSLLSRYLTAYPALPAGSLPLVIDQPHEVVIPQTPISGARRRFLASILPWKGDTRRERLLKCGVWVAVIAAVVLIAGLVAELISESGNQQLYSNLQNSYSATTPNTDTETETGITSRFSALYAQNADIGGWIRIDGTHVNYPVMKNAGSDYYATHNFRQQASVYGVPYFDSRNSIISAESQNRALIIYGNNTRDGQMFSDLLSYRNLEFFQNHSTLEMNTLFSNAKWQLFAVMILDPDEINAFRYAHTDFSDAADFRSYVAEIQKRSLFRSSVAVNDKDKLLLLVTQAEKEYGFHNAQMVLVARRLQQADTADSNPTVSQNPTVLMPRIWIQRSRGNAKVTRRTTTTAVGGTTTAADTPPDNRTNPDNALTDPTTLQPATPGTTVSTPSEEETPPTSTPPDDVTTPSDPPIDTDDSDGTTNRPTPTTASSPDNAVHVE